MSFFICRSERRLRAWQEKISTHSLTRRLTKNKGFFLINYTFQLTASQGGWLHGGNNNDKRTGISTHSLTRRLTRSPTKHAQAIIFQLTASQGGWPCCALPDPERWCISTHSLTRRLTGISPRLKRNSKHFNSQPHKEADDDSSDKATIVSTFQLTASQGGWQFPIENVFMGVPFQLTASQGGWQNAVRQWLRFRDISTHSLTRRLTGNSTKKSTVSGYFNSQPHKEADR